MSSADIPIEQLNFFANFIENELGIIYAKDNIYQLNDRIIEISRIMEKSPDDIYHMAKSDGINGYFRQLLLDTATNNETSFFRDSAMFEALQNEVLPQLIESSPGKVLRFWSAACSFGQEVYTFSMIIDQLKSKYPNLQWEMLATDISSKALNKAKSGQYGQLEVQRGLPITYLVKYFNKTDQNCYTVNPKLREHIDFQEANLLNLMRISGPFDLIFCRNVLIYQNEERKKKIIQEITKKLDHGKYLILGGAENLSGLSNEYHQKQIGKAILYQKK